MMMMMAQMNTSGGAMGNTINPAAAMNSVSPMTPMNMSMMNTPNMNMMAPPPMSGMTQTPNSGFPSGGANNAMSADQKLKKIDIRQ